MKEGPWERGESKEGPSFTPIPQNIQAAANSATAMLRGPQGEPATPKGRMKVTMPMLRASIAKGSQLTMAKTEGGAARQETMEDGDG